MCISVSVRDERDELTHIVICDEANQTVRGTDGIQTEQCDVRQREI